jgi:hypothetical protein
MRITRAISFNPEIVEGFVPWEWCLNVVVGRIVYLPDLVEHISR